MNEFIPYYAVIFSSLKNSNSNGYDEMSSKMVELVSKQSGFLGSESFRNSDGQGVTISYWKDLESVRSWKQNSEHLIAQKLGKSWYQNYHVRICRVESEHGFKL